MASNLPEKWSKVIPSKNNKYVFVMISPFKDELDAYIKHMDAFWANGGIPKENIPEAKRLLAEEIKKEEEIRSKYPKSGLYLAGKDSTLLWPLDIYEAGSKSLISVSDDGKHLVHHKTYISPIFGPNADISSNNRLENADIYPNREETV